jgi:hypothetical protein
MSSTVAADHSDKQITLESDMKAEALTSQFFPELLQPLLAAQLQSTLESIHPSFVDRVQDILSVPSAQHR